jgi:hypothetical protein
MTKVVDERFERDLCDFCPKEKKRRAKQKLKLKLTHKKTKETKGATHIICEDHHPENQKNGTWVKARLSKVLYSEYDLKEAEIIEMDQPDLGIPAAF